MTVAERIRAEGYARGWTLGRAALLADQLVIRFGSLDVQQQQVIDSGSPEQITTWSDRLVDGATTLDEVIG